MKLTGGMQTARTEWRFYIAEFEWLQVSVMVKKVLLKNQIGLARISENIRFIIDRYYFRIP